MTTARNNAGWVIPWVLIAGLTTTALGQQPRRVAPSNAARPEASASRWQTAERWTERLADDLDHLHEDLQYEHAGGGLLADAEAALEAVVHFQEVVRRGAEREHLLRDFRTMDRQVHRLIDQLQGSRAGWLRRASARIEYADEQLHYHLRARDAGDGETFRELVARHAHVLEQEGKQLAQLAQYYRRQPGGDAAYRAIADFAEAAEHFHEVVEGGADRAHLRSDFRELDRAWHEAVEHINRSGTGISLRLSAQRVNNVHNQLHTVIDGGQEHADGHQHEAEARERPGVEFTIPGIGRIRL